MKNTVFDESLGSGVTMPNLRLPIPILELLKDNKTKAALNKMALDEEYRDKVWSLQ